MTEHLTELKNAMDDALQVYKDARDELKEAEAHVARSRAVYFKSKVRWEKADAATKVESK